MRGDLAACLTLLAMAIAAPAQAQLPEPAYDLFPVQPPLALPQQLNGVIRRSSEPGDVPRIDRIREVFAAMRACWRPPRFREGPTGLQVTLRASFKRNGDAVGRPRITYFQPGGDRDARDRFVGSISEAFRRCSPLPFTAAFGSAIAGRPFTFRFVDDRQS
jgi:hypothetical protein